MRVKVGVRAAAAAAAAMAFSVPAGSDASVAAAGARSTQGFAPDLPARSDPSLARSSATSSGRNDRRQLRRKLRRLARSAPSSSGFYVYDLDAGGRRVLFDRREGKRRRLASNTKLFTTAAALDRFGADGRLETSVGATGEIERGRLDGNLYLIGGGDPSLGGAGIRSLAKAVKRSGIRTVRGNLYADDSIFDRKRGVPDTGWRPGPYLNPLSGLTYGGSTYSTDPAIDAARALRDRLRKRGVRIRGKLAVRRAPGRVEEEPLAIWRSPKMAKLANDTNVPSNNFYAEMLLKGLGASAGRRGTTKRGRRAAERYARSIGAKVDLRDGSGLTDDNRASPRDVVGLLRGMLDQDAGSAFRRSLARVGREGTLAERMRGTPAARRCRAKTGTISGVSALSGYCRAGRGTVAFSLLMNGVGSYDAARTVQDRMTIEIARYRP